MLYYIFHLAYVSVKINVIVYMAGKINDNN